MLNLAFFNQGLHALFRYGYSTKYWCEPQVSKIVGVPKTLTS